MDDKNWDAYLQYVKNMAQVQGHAPLTVGGTDHLTPTAYENLFVPIPAYQELVRTYPIPALSSAATAFRKALAIMDWLTENTWYNGMQGEALPDDSLQILFFSVGKGFGNAINCRHKAIAFTDLLLAHGVKAYPILLLGGEGERRMCHFAVHVFCPEERKWALFDPSFHCYFMDGAQTVLDVYQLRELFLDGRTPTVVGYSFNGTKECKEIYLRYFIEAGLTNLSTWENNTEERRKDPNDRKYFCSKLPDLNQMEAERK